MKLGAKKWKEKRRVKRREDLVAIRTTQCSKHVIKLLGEYSCNQSTGGWVGKSENTLQRSYCLGQVLAKEWELPGRHSAKGIFGQYRVITLGLPGQGCDRRQH